MASRDGADWPCKMALVYNGPSSFDAVLSASLWLAPSRSLFDQRDEIRFNGIQACDQRLRIVQIALFSSKAVEEAECGWPLRVLWRFLLKLSSPLQQPLSCLNQFQAACPQPPRRSVRHRPAVSSYWPAGVAGVPSPGGSGVAVRRR